MKTLIQNILAGGDIRALIDESVSVKEVTEDYNPPRGPKTDDLDFIAQRIAYYLKNRNLDHYSKEDVIEIFRSMNDDYDDWFARGLRTQSQEDDFVNDLISRIENNGVEITEARKFKKGSGKRIEFEDDLVRVYDENGDEIYAGLEDYEPLKDEDWRFDPKIGAYRFGNYIKNAV